MKNQKPKITLKSIIGSLVNRSTDHPIPANSKSPWDYRGEPRTIINKYHDELFECKTYEELVKKLDLTIDNLEYKPNSLTSLYVASGCRLARIRAYYIMGKIESADKLLERYCAVYRKRNGTPDFGERESEKTNKPNKSLHPTESSCAVKISWWV